PTYPAVDCIGDWLDEAPAANTTISGTVTVVYQNNLDLFVQDETGTVLVYGSLPHTYESGDQLSGITGKYKAFNMLPQFTPVSTTFGEPTGKTAAIKPAKVTLADVDVQNLEHYVTVSGLEIVSETTTADDKTTTTYYATDGTNKVEIYNRYRLETLAEASDVTITGFVWIYGNDNTPTKIELVPTEISDNAAITEISADAAAGQVYDLLGRRVVAPTRGLYIIGGRKVLVK
ncbi:MAG: hypothetical protein K2M97_01930, partial [Muribaculaceae bacterium]|nr:hypothetical protein [Muribaculaceae bacterium]